MNITHIQQIINSPLFKNNSTQHTLAFKGQLKADSFEKTHKTPELKKGQIIDKNGEIFTRPETGMFRTDLNWEDFGKYLKTRFNNEYKVNTYAYACSTGEEAYTLSMLLQDIMDYNAEKFFPIYAKDINDNLIEQNILDQKGKIINNGYLPARWTLGLNDREVSEYITLEMDLNSSYETEKLTDKTTSPVEFSTANILEDIENIDSYAPSIIMCRNMWPYVNPEEYQEFADKLYDKLAPGSIVVIGGYDYKGEDGQEGSNHFPETLLKSGFEPADFHKSFIRKGATLIFEKN